MHIHILGICGTFMGGIAVIAKQAGHTVSGCDANAYPPMSTQLEAQGIRLTEGWDRSQIDLQPDLFVVGNVVSRGNPLMEEILDRGLPYTSGPQWLAEIETQFHHLVRTVPENGLIITNARETSLQRVLDRGCWTPVEQFGVADGWSTRDINGEGAFEVLFKGTPQGRVQWQLNGEHNRMNALASIAAARHTGVPAATAVEALSVFRNVKRRMEKRGDIGGITIYDDFAHHPTAIETTIAGLRATVGDARILAVLEPRSNTMKKGNNKDALAASLAGADVVFCYTDGLEWDASVTLESLGAKLQCVDDIDKLTDAIAASSRSGDHVLVMSNGGFGNIHEKLLIALGAS